MPSPGAMSNRRFLVLLLAVSGFLSFSFVFFFRQRPIGTRAPNYGTVPIHHVNVSPETLSGNVIMPNLGNETLKWVAIDTGENGTTDVLTARLV